MRVAFAAERDQVLFLVSARMAAHKRAPELSPARGIIWGAQGFRVRLTYGLTRTTK